MGWSSNYSPNGVKTTSRVISIVDKNNFFRSLIVQKFLSKDIAHNLAPILNQSYYDPLNLSPMELAYPLVWSGGVAVPESGCNNITQREFWNSDFEKLFQSYGFDIEKLKQHKYQLIDQDFINRSTVIYALDTKVYDFLNERYGPFVDKLKLLSELQHIKFDFEDPDDKQEGRVVTLESIESELKFLHQFCLEREKEFIDELVRRERRMESKPLELRRGRR